MNAVDICTLIPGTRAQKNVYSLRGQLLLVKGLPITGQMLERLRQLKIYEVCLDEENEDTEATEVYAADHV